MGPPPAILPLVSRRTLSTLVFFALAVSGCSGDDSTAGSTSAVEDTSASTLDTSNGAQDGPREDDAYSASGPDAVAPSAETTPDIARRPPAERPWRDDPAWQCDHGVPISAVVDIVLPANSAGCPWNEGANLAFAQGAFAAHQLTVAAAELPGPAQAICHVDLESAVFDPDYAQSFVYDDHFILAFDDVVLLSSYGDLIDTLPRDRNLYLFDWEAMAGAAMNFNNNSAYCLGYGGEDPVDCAVPAPETGGPVAYSAGGGLGAELSRIAVEEQRIEFMLVTFGDNDPNADCRNSELRMRILVDYVIAP